RTRDCCVDAELNGGDFRFQRYRAGSASIGHKEIACQGAKIVSEVDPAEVSRTIELFLNTRHTVYALAAFHEHVQGMGVAHASGLKTEQAANDLKVVLHTMLNFLDQNVFLSKRRPDAFFGTLSFCNVPGYCMDGRHAPGLVPYWPARCF